MNWLDAVFDILKYTIPLVVAFGFIYFILNNYLDENYKIRSLDMKLSNQNQITPVRLQAYERVVVYLERIAPSSLIMRIHKSGMSSRLLHTELLKSIRSEYEHNIAQQIYMSNASWELVKSAKEEMINLVNVASQKVSDNADGLELCRVLIDITKNVEKLPTQIALEYVKKEIRQSF